MKVLREIRIDELSAVDAPAQEGAKALLMKRRDAEDLAKVAFQDALTELKLEESVYEACRELWTLDEALRRSVQEIVENKDKYPNPNQALKDSLAQFANAVATMVSGVIQDVGKQAKPNPQMQQKITRCVEEKTSAWLAKHPDVAADGGKPPSTVVAQFRIDCQNAMKKDMEKAEHKTEDGETFPASDYAYVPDPEKPSTWKLRLTSTPGGSPDQRIIGAAVAALGPGFRGQKVEIPEEALAGVKRKVRSAWLKANPEKSKEDLPEALKMMHGQDDEEDEDMAKTIEQLERELAYAQAYGVLTDLEKRYANALTQTDREKFVSLSASDRSAELAKRDAADPVVYEAADGRKFRASHDTDLVSMAKRLDIAEKTARENAAAAQEVELAKRAEDLKHLPGKPEVRVAVLRAIEAIQDAELKKSALEMLKAQDAALGEAFKTHGIGSLKPASTAEQQLDTLAKRRAEDKKISYAQAYSEVMMQTEEGRRLYAETVGR